MTTGNCVIVGSLSQSKGTIVGYPKSNESVDLTIILRRRKTLTEEQNEIARTFIYDFPSQRSYISNDEIKSFAGAYPEDLEAVKNFFKEHNFSITSESIDDRAIQIKGCAIDFEAAFGARLARYQGVDKHIHLSYEGYLYADAEIANAIIEVTGLAVSVKKEFRVPTHPQAVENNKGWETGHSVASLKKSYHFPEDVTGKGQTIGLIELGGQFSKRDINKFFSLSDISKPKIKVVGSATGPASVISNAEVTLDIQVAGATAPDATIVVYYAHTLIEAMRLVVNDTVNNPTILSISWAGAESYYHQKEMEEFDNLFFEAALKGITILAASGDYGAYCGTKSPQVMVPACHPHALGVGGTDLVTEDDRIQSEVVWNENSGTSASGGGFSKFYPLPWYQMKIVNECFGHVHQRGVPDVAASASSANGYHVFFNGVKTSIGGTSASTPLWAGLIALLNEKLGYNLGFSNMLLYHLGGTFAFNQILYGNNQLYGAGAGWNPCTGLGSPNGKLLLELIQAQDEWISEQNKS